MSQFTKSSIRFYQEYSNNRHQDKGYKTLYLECDENKTECKITKEEWEASEYKKALLLTPYIERRMKDIKLLEKNPLAFSATNNSKKKSLNQQNIVIFT